MALQTAEYLNNYANDIKDRKHDIEDLRQELMLLSNVLGQLRDFVALQKSQDASFDSNSVLKTAISDCTRRLERVGDRLKSPSGGRLARTIDKLKWPFDKDEVQKLTTSLQRFVQTFTFALTTQGLTILAKTSDLAMAELQEKHAVFQKMTDMCKQMDMSTAESEKKTEQLGQILVLLPTLLDQSNDIREMSQHMRLAEEREQARQKSEILEWLVPASTLQRHVETQRKRANNTCEWFLQSRQFQEWQSPDTPASDLLCMGNPGVGKTVLSSFIFDHLRQKHNTEGAVVMNYYCSHFETKTQTASHLIRTLLRQVCQTLERVPVAVVEFHRETRHNIEDVLWFQELQSVLYRTLATCDKIFLVIDALDEIETIRQRNAILQALKDLRSANGNLRILATTRPHLSELHSHFHLPSTIDIAANPRDIEVYLKEKLAEQDLDLIIDPELEHEIVMKLSSNADGTFLLPALQLEHILQQVTRADVKRALSALSKTLDEAFKTSLDRIYALSPMRKELAMRTMMWISYAKRPLLMTELQQALAIREGDANLDRDNIVPSRIILESCSGLVQLDKETGTTTFVHFSLDEYLRSQARGVFDGGERTIVRACLTFLCYSSLRQLPSMGRTNFLSALNDLPFLKYAASEWGHHARSLDVTTYSDLVLPFFDNSMNLLAVSRVRDVDSPAAANWHQRTTSWAFSGGAGVSVAAYYGLVDLVKLLLTQVNSSVINTCRNMYGSLALHEAAMYGHADVCEILVQHGANFMDTNKGKGTPFYLAVSYDRLEVAQTLLKHNRAQLDLTYRDGWTALHKAADMGSESMVQFLLSSGALVAARDEKYMTPLHIAARRGHLVVARLLILAGADVTTSSRDSSETPLDLSAISGYTSLVRYLIEQGAIVNRISGDGWTPLLRACRGGHLETAELLLQHGAYVLFQDYRKNTSLHVATRSGNMKLVKVLLEHDPSITLRMLQQKDKKRNSAQHIAFFTANFNIYKYLRDLEQRLLSGDNLQVQVYDPVMPLALSIEAGDLTTTEILVRNDIRLLSTADRFGQLPLHIAFVEKAADIASFLLESGASISSRGFHAWQPLHIAASIGSLEMTELALAHGADVHATTETLQTPLLKAVSANSLSVMRCLLQAGADPRARNDRNMTSLHVAASKKFMEGIRELVHPDWGAQEVVHWRDKSSKLPRHWAEKAGHLEAATFLRLQEKLVKNTNGLLETINSFSNSQDDFTRTDTNASRMSLVSRTSSGAHSPGLNLDQRNERYTQIVLEMDSD